MPLPLRLLAAAGVLAALVTAGLVLHDHASYGRGFSFSIASGAAFGAILQRSRFCFASAFRDVFLLGDRRMALGVLAALATGSLGYITIFGAWIPDPAAGYLPDKAHIAPAGWHLLAGGAAFGLGMVLAGGCISGNLYRLGEGSLAAPAALLATIPGYWAGFAAWPFLWSNAVSASPVVWLPKPLGYLGALALQLAVLAAVAALLLRRLPGLPRQAQEAVTPGAAVKHVFVRGWPAWIGGAAAGCLATLVLLRTSPLGVTAEIGRLARKSGGALGLVPPRLEGLDGLAGCRPILGDAVLTENGAFVAALVAGSLAAALLAGEFRLRAARPRTVGLALAGGVLLGFGAMISLGCTVGTLLSGIMALSLSGWTFALGLTGGAWAGGRLLRRLV